MKKTAFRQAFFSIRRYPLVYSIAYFQKRLFAMKKLFFAAFLFSLSLTSCQKQDVQTFACEGATPTYTADIKAILNTNCATSGCHNASSRANGIDLSTYEKAKSESSRNRFLGAIQHKSGYNPMPQGRAKLDDATIQLISCWVQNGSLE